MQHKAHALVLHEVRCAPHFNERAVIHLQPAPRRKAVHVVVEFTQQTQRRRFNAADVGAPAVVHAIGRAHDAAAIRCPVRAEAIFFHQRLPHELANGGMLNLPFAAAIVLPALFHQHVPALQDHRRAGFGERMGRRVTRKIRRGAVQHELVHFVRVHGRKAARTRRASGPADHADALNLAQIHNELDHGFHFIVLGAARHQLERVTRRGFLFQNVRNQMMLRRHVNIARIIHHRLG